jgi:hypothetical protein
VAGDYRTQLDYKRQRWAALKLERSSWMPHWRVLGQFFSPRTGRFNEGQNSPNQGGQKHQDIYDNTPLYSVRVLTAGLQAGVTSAARPWFRLRTPYADLNERPAVKSWLDLVEKRMRDIFAQSNTYRTFRMLYKQLAIFGTAGSVMLPDYEDVIRHYPMAIGEFGLGLNGRGAVDTLYREFDMNVGQMVQRFGYKNCSLTVRNLYDNRNLTAWLPVLHAIEPRRERDPLKTDNKNMPYSSCYMELNGDAEGKFLRESGMRQFRALTPRWELENASDAFGSSPGMEALGDTKQLQHQQFRKSQGIDYMTKPPLQIPSAQMMQGINTAPGAANPVDAVGTGIKSLWDVQLRLDHLLQDIQDVRYRCKRAFYEDLFMFMSSAERSGGVQPPSPREVAERHEEKLIMLGPVLESLHDELLSPKIEMTFADMLEAGLVPPPPREMNGMPLTIQFVSLLAQAQRLVGLGAVDRLVGTLITIAPIKPDILDKLDTDQLVDVYSDMLGTDPSLVVADENVALIREQRQQSQRAMLAAQAAPDAAKAAKDLSESDPNTANAAVAALQSLGGVP